MNRRDRDRKRKIRRLRERRDALAAEFEAVSAAIVDRSAEIGLRLVPADVGPALGDARPRWANSGNTPINPAAHLFDRPDAPEGYGKDLSC